MMQTFETVAGRALAKLNRLLIRKSSKDCFVLSSIICCQVSWRKPFIPLHVKHLSDKCNSLLGDLMHFRCLITFSQIKPSKLRSAKFIRLVKKTTPHIHTKNIWTILSIELRNTFASSLWWENLLIGTVNYSHWRALVHLSSHRQG